MEERRKAILIVEDEEVSRTILKEMLKDKYAVYESANGRDAIELISEMGDGLSLIVLDIHMPEVDGFGVLDYLKDNNLSDTIPVIISTSDTSSDVMITSRSRKVAEIIYKPFSASEVRNCVDNVIDICNFEKRLGEIVEEKSLKIVNDFEKYTYRRKVSHKKKIALWKTLVTGYLPNSAGHNLRMEEYVSLLLHEASKRYDAFKLTEEQISEIIEALIVHDFGSVIIPDDLYRQGVSVGQRAVMQIRKQPIAASELIDMMFSGTELDLNKRYCFEICRFMNERYEGKGYPEGLFGDEIPISAQAVSLMHRYDVLRHPNNTSFGVGHREAVKIILEAEYKSFNPDLLDLFEELSPSIEIISNKQ